MSEYIRTNKINTIDCINISIQTKLILQMSEYILLTNKIDTNECLKKKHFCPIYFNIQINSSHSGSIHPVHSYLLNKKNSWRRASGKYEKKSLRKVTRAFWIVASQNPVLSLSVGTSVSFGALNTLSREAQE